MNLLEATDKKIDLRKAADNPFFWWICFTIAFGIVAAMLQTDRSWDLRNYHFYNGFAAFYDRRALDIVPAQGQTMLFPSLDPIYFTIFTSLNDRPSLINILLSIPYSVSALAIFLVARPFARLGFAWPNLASTGATSFRVWRF
jgi:hypothetical protein